jgi:hypothetical protein
MASEISQEGQERAKPVGIFVGIADEYGTIWDGEPGVSNIIGDIVVRADEETCEVYVLPPKDAS